MAKYDCFMCDEGRKIEEYRGVSNELLGAIIVMLKLCSRHAGEMNDLHTEQVKAELERTVA